MEQVELKRKIQNPETKLLEWVRCRCTITSDKQFLDIQLEKPETNSSENNYLRINMATEFRSVCQKKKNKARCELVYDPVGSGRTEKEEFMAASSRHCLHWVEQLIHASNFQVEKNGSNSPLGVQIQPIRTENFRLSNDFKEQNEYEDSDRSAHKFHTNRSPKPKVAAHESNDKSSSYWEGVFSRIECGVRLNSPLSVSSTISESNNNTRIAAGTYAANNKRRESSAKVNFEIPLYHEDMVEQESDSHLRSEARWGTFVNLDHNDQKYNREELCILSRVEGALRKLEKENLDGKSRESLFLQEIADLKDALRVHAAEKTRMEDEVARLSIEKEEWKLEAHRSATAMNQLQEELAIAKEEAKLLHGENIRLKHQNKELTTHVFRLDTLVYGKF